MFCILGLLVFQLLLLICLILWCLLYGSFSCIHCIHKFIEKKSYGACVHTWCTCNFTLLFMSWCLFTHITWHLQQEISLLILFSVYYCHLSSPIIYLPMSYIFTWSILLILKRFTLLGIFLVYINIFTGISQNYLVICALQYYIFCTCIYTLHSLCYVTIFFSHFVAWRWGCGLPPGPF